jgi:glycerate dehydrogenase
VRIVVLDSFAADRGENRWSKLEQLGQVSVYPRTSNSELEARAREADALLTNKVGLDATAVRALPDLRYIGITATGTNIVDLAECRERGVAVTNVPAYSTDSVAQLVFAMILHFTHGVAQHALHVKSGDWARAPDFTFSVQPLRELRGKVLTILGMGSIGRRVALIASAFGMHVLAGSVPGSDSSGRTALAEALPCSDFVSLHCPLTPATRGLVDAAFLAQMKAGAVLINTGRGALVDERALLEALASGVLGGAALDVLAEEPPPSSHPLLDASSPWSSRLLVTPHIGWATEEARARLITASIDNLEAFVRGERLNRVD